MRLIDADRLSEAIHENVSAPYEEAVWAKEDCLAEIEAAQTVDAVEVVRCRECKWSKRDALLDKHWCKHFFGEMEVRENDYCSYGERKGCAD